METNTNRPIDQGLGTEALDALWTVPATGIADDPIEDSTSLPIPAVRRSPQAAPAPSPDLASGSEPNSPADSGIALGDRREYQFCRAVAENPLRPSSDYPGLAGISPKLAIPIRQKLLAMGLLRQEALDDAGRGRTSMLLIVTDQGRAALQAYRTWHGEER